MQSILLTRRLLADLTDFGFSSLTSLKVLEIHTSSLRTWTAEQTWAAFAKFLNTLRLTTFPLLSAIKIHLAMRNIEEISSLDTCPGFLALIERHLTKLKSIVFTITLTPPFQNMLRRPLSERKKKDAAKIICTYLGGLEGVMSSGFIDVQFP